MTTMPEELDRITAEYLEGLLNTGGPFLIERLVGLPTPSCLLCFEKDPAQCHRPLIAEYMARRGWIIEHILRAKPKKPPASVWRIARSFCLW